MEFIFYYCDSYVLQQQLFGTDFNFKVIFTTPI